MFGFDSCKSCEGVVIAKSAITESDPAESESEPESEFESESESESESKSHLIEFDPESESKFESEFNPTDLDAFTYCWY